MQVIPTLVEIDNEEKFDSEISTGPSSPALQRGETHRLVLYEEGHGL